MTARYDALLAMVPRLRRYGRLLTGSREAADDYAQLCLERLLHMPRSASGEAIARDMFSTLHRVVSDAEIELDTAIPPEASRLEQELLSLSVEERKAVLLSHVEGLSDLEAGGILGWPIEAFRSRLAAGRARLRRNLCASVFIVEDELLVALDMTQLVEEFGHSVCGTARRGIEAIEGIEAHRPALVLADVQLGDSERAGIDACERFRNRYDLEVIYVTGHPDRVRRALKRDNVLVVPKPVERETLRHVMGRALGLAG